MGTPRLAVGIWSALLAAGLGVAALRLPWRPGGVFTVVIGTLAAAHAVTAILCAIGHSRRQTAWRVQSLLALAAFGVLAFEVIASAAILGRIYGGLGTGVGAAIGLALLALAAPVLPLAIWGLVAWRRPVVAALIALALVATAWTWREADVLAGRPPAGRARVDPAERPATGAVAVCPAPPDEAPATTFISSRAGVECMQADSAEALRAQVLARVATAERPFALDEIVTVAPLHSLPLAVMDGLMVRPAVDGVCAGARCLAPWQLVAADALTAERPVAAVPDVRFGVSRVKLTALLGGPPSLRVASRTTVLATDGSTLALDRGRAPAPAFDGAALSSAAAAAERYILAAQEPDGRFAYSLDPFTGVRSMSGFGVPRQAGTTLALCELGSPGPRVAEAARRSIEVLLRESSRAPAAAVRRLGPSALVLAALIACRPRVGDAYDGDIATLTATLVAMARPDGGFHHQLDPRTGPLPGPDALYASGQAMLALVLAERLALPGGPDLRRVVERAMSYFAHDYWPSFLRPLFFLEENWHCLAARAALPFHRHDGYEQLCLDYAASRHRFLLGEDVAPAHRGGLGFSNLVPPHNTPTAGTGEVLAAAIAVRLARGEDPTVERADLRGVLAFLLRNQWRGPECFACAAPERVAGGFSESVASPAIRIDYVQHAWAALGHGASVLGR